MFSFGEVRLSGQTSPSFTKVGLFSNFLGRLSKSLKFVEFGLLDNLIWNFFVKKTSIY